MNTKRNTCSAILDEAQDLVQLLSINCVSFQELAKRIGNKKGNTYYHSESKDDLSAALLERAAQELKTSFDLGKEKSPTKRLSYFFSIYQYMMKQGEKMCPSGAYVSVWETLAEPVRLQVKNVICTQIDGVQEILEAGLEDGEFNNRSQSPNELALWIVSSLQGTLLTSRVIDNNSPFDCATKLIVQHLNHR